MEGRHVGSGSRLVEGAKPAGRPTLARGATVVLAVAALGTLALAASATSATAKPSHRLILTPHAGRKLPARPVWIRLRVAKGARHLAVRLNGEEIGGHFSARNARGVRKLQASASFGLRHGRNRLRVRLRRADGGIRARAIRFRIRRNKPLAAAGIDRTVAVGSRVVLNGKRSRSHRRHRPALKHRWRIRRRPRGSAAGARLVGARSKRPRFVADQPGRYVLRLRVRARDGRTGSDLVDVRADPPPAASLNTMARSPNDHGIQVGAGDKGFYPAKPGAWAQLVALDRETLEPITGKIADLANKSYPCPGLHYGDPQLPKCIDALKTDLKRLDGHDLAIVSNLPGGTPGFGLELATTRIGVGVGGFNQAPADLLPGSFSAIGVPGAGRANWHAVPAAASDPDSTGEGQGRMRGYLVRNNEGEYVFSPADRIGFDTQASGSDADKNVVALGLQRLITGPARGSTGGLQVVVADRRTLAATSQFFDTGADIFSQRDPALRGLEALLKRANDGSNFVFVESRGVPSIQAAPDHFKQDDNNSALSGIANQIEKLGGTRNGIFTALDRGLGHSNSYSLVGWSHAGAGQAVQTVGPTTKSGFALNTAPLVGTLAPTGPNYAFELQTSRSIPSDSTGADPSRGATELTTVAFQLPSAWPEQGNAGREAAIGWIGKQVFGTDDPRGQYWTVPFVKDQFDYAYWTEAAARIGKLDHPSQAAFTEGELGWAKAELQREIGWLVSTHRYLDNLSTPFAKGQLQSWADFQQIADAIRDKVVVSKDKQVHANARALFNGIRELAGVIPGPGGKAFEAANAIYSTVMEFVEINGEPAEDDFQPHADEYGVKLAERLSEAQGMLDRHLPNIISADYEKLKTVGQCASPDPQVWASCPFDHGDWQYTQDDQATAAKGLRSELQIAAYGSLLPARYTAYQLPPWWRKKASDDFYGYTASGFHFAPFAGLPDTAQMAKPIYRNLPTYSHTLTGGPGRTGSEPWNSTGETWQITALGYLSGKGTFTEPWVMHYPEASVTDRLFKTGGENLGVDPETFFDRNFTPQPLDHYPELDAPTGWCANDHDPCGS